MNENKMIPCILVADGKAVRWFDDRSLVSGDVRALAGHYADCGADTLMMFDLSDSDEGHEESIGLMKKIHAETRLSLMAGGNVRRLEDVKKYLYAGAAQVMLSVEKEADRSLLKEAALRFGKEKLSVILSKAADFARCRSDIENDCTQLILMPGADPAEIRAMTDIPCTAVSTQTEEAEVAALLRADRTAAFESSMDFSQFKVDMNGLLPVIVQDFRTGEVLMQAYMDQEAFENTIRTGRMTYYSRSRKQQWVKGETSGHYQYVKSLAIDCDNDTLLAKVDQVGAACHTGNRSCFYRTIAGTDAGAKNPLQIFEEVYATIEDRKKNPKEGSYTNYLFDKGIDKILKKLGEEATEIVIAAKNPDPEEIKYEISDFLYHAMVLMVERGVTWEDITRELADR